MLFGNCKQNNEIIEIYPKADPIGDILIWEFNFSTVSASDTLYLYSNVIRVNTLFKFLFIFNFNGREIIFKPFKMIS